MLTVAVAAAAYVLWDTPAVYPFEIFVVWAAEPAFSPRQHDLRSVREARQRVRVCS